jgi:hypothetical protein
VRALFDEQLSAAIEVAALACALQPVIVFTSWSPADGGMPRLCRDLVNLGLDCQPAAADTVAAPAAIERDFLCHLLVHAGATPLFCAGLRIAVIHILAPNTLIARTGLDELQAGEDDAKAGAQAHDDEPAAADWWLDARVFWYRLAEGATVAATRLVES